MSDSRDFESTWSDIGDTTAEPFNSTPPYVGGSVKPEVKLRASKQGNKSFWLSDVARCPHGFMSTGPDYRRCNDCGVVWKRNVDDEWVMTNVVNVANNRFCKHQKIGRQGDSIICIDCGDILALIGSASPQLPCSGCGHCTADASFPGQPSGKRPCFFCVRNPDRELWQTRRVQAGFVKITTWYDGSPILKYPMDCYQPVDMMRQTNQWIQRAEACGKPQTTQVSDGEIPKRKIRIA